MADGLTDEGWTPCAWGPAAGAACPWAAVLLRGIEFLRAWASSGWSKADDISDDDELLASWNSVWAGEGSGASRLPGLEAWWN